ncbi:uncharacterized protein LOC132256666 [Phlebotomus argentipes]|uniref:uncharacterized protein LOC132256666 n=1 Tax=Phlebotomus argentipes TaxID=94469 RepID=UPI002892C948|nr:uncharacterized protein LOC132256666 [Phlebotomus argentipes]
MATDADIRKLRAGIMASVKSARAYITSIKAADLSFLSWEYVVSLRTHVEQKRAEFLGVQDQLIAEAMATSDDAVKREESIRDDVLAEVDGLLSHIEKMLSRMTPPSSASTEPAAAKTAPAAAKTAPDTEIFCTLMREMMAQNQQQMMHLISTLSNPTASTNNSSAHLAKPPIKLPQISLPTFGGRYADWMSFRDRFESCIVKHPSLSDVERLNYLQSALSGDAASTIKHLPTIGANFSVAWRLLRERYERKNEIVAEHVRSFYQMPSVSDDPHAIRSICNLLSESLLALDALQVTGRDPWIIQFTLDKLDTESRVLWGRECGSEVPTMEQFRKFLNQRCIDAANASDPPSTLSSDSRSQSSKPHSDTKKKVQAFHNASTASTCRCCSEASHPLYRCPRFIAQNPTERFETVKKLNLCRNCLASHHTSACTFHSCKKCQARHNVLLHEKFADEAPANLPAPSPHPPNPNSAEDPSSSSDGPSNPAPENSAVSLTASTWPTNCHPSAYPKVFLATAMVDILTGDNQRISCRVMLDGGAQVSIMTTSLYNRLRLPKKPSNISILGVGSQVNPVKHKVTATVFSQKSGQSFTFDCHILPKISGNIPNWPVDTRAIRVPPGVEMADPQWDVQRPIDLLICGDAYWGSLLPDRISLGEGLPQLQRTAFGYVMVGEHLPPHYAVHVHHVQAEPALDEALIEPPDVDGISEEASAADRQLKAGLWRSAASMDGTSPRIPRQHGVGRNDAIPGECGGWRRTSPDVAPAHRARHRGAAEEWRCGMHEREAADGASRGALPAHLEADLWRSEAFKPPWSLRNTVPPPSCLSGRSAAEVGTLLDWQSGSAAAWSHWDGAAGLLVDSPLMSEGDPAGDAFWRSPVCQTLRENFLDGSNSRIGPSSPGEDVQENLK